MKKVYALLLAAGIFCMADTIKFKNGAVVEGKIVDEDAQTITIEAGGAKTTYAKIDIAFIQKGGRHISPPPPPPAKAAAPSKNLGTPVSRAQTPAILPGGTHVRVETSTVIDSRNSRPGQEFRAFLVGDLKSSDGHVIAASGSQVYLEVVDSEQAGRMIGKSALAVRLSAITADGRRIPVNGSVVVVEAQKSQGRDTARKTLIGAGIGAIANDDHRKGARKGALVGLGVAALTRGEAVAIPAGKVIEFTIRSDVKL
ncbi:hypothetical protein [Hydrogenimonas sp.]|uniref:hypothetical protein n=1 Tax=Hydrogenimonas sp. TaxID=2231112 RepID=UPI00262544B0|nr:hypothetical protein [Hydrogenimonas sp.]